MARTSDITNLVKRVIIYGPSGSGKTQLAATYPNPVFIDFDKGMLTLKDKDIEYYIIKNKPTIDPDAIKIIGEKSALKDNAYLKSATLIEHFANVLREDSTLVLDSLSTFSNYVLAHVLKLARLEVPRIQDWGAAQKIIETTVELLTECECNIVLVAHEEFLTDKKTGAILRILPMTIGKLAAKLPLYFDEVYHTYTAKGDKKNNFTKIFGIETSGDRRTCAKSRLNLTANIEFPTYDKLYGKGGKK